MMSTPQVFAFGGVIVLGAMSPGPDFAVVVRRAAASGRRHGMATGLGVSVGMGTWAIAAATGVATLLAASGPLFTAVQMAGTAYLVYLGFRALRSAAASRMPVVADPVLAAADVVSHRVRRRQPGRHFHPPPLLASFREGLLCNALNPKAAVFFVALVPQFLSAEATIADTLLLAGIAVGITVLWFLLVANLVDALRRVIARPAVRRTVDGLSGAVLIALGVRLAMSGV